MTWASMDVDHHDRGRYRERVENRLLFDVAFPSLPPCSNPRACRARAEPRQRQQRSKQSEVKTCNRTGRDDDERQ